MKKTSTVRVNGNMIFKGHKLTIGMDLGDHWSCYCVLDEAGEILLEQKVATTPKAMKEVFAHLYEACRDAGLPVGVLPIEVSLVVQPEEAADLDWETLIREGDALLIIEF